ncbi:MAG: glycerophosphodiester phosphodiesterase family protein [Candidatus Bathyarchaeia archaeon]|nr:glycerophosphodiester phosphodiesterase [Candidatus Bathyarchaeota archaeon]
MLELRIGHRGARAYEPENTIRSFRRAIELGVNAVELDVRKTKDNELVVIHDDKVDRITSGKGLVSELTLEEIKSLVTDKGERIPTLEEALEFLDRKARILIELKEVGVEDEVMKIVRNKGLEDNVIVISFHEEALRRVREISDKVEIGLIYVKHKDPIKAALDLKANYLLPMYKFVHSTFVKKAHQNGLKVIAWTINTLDEAQEYANKGVDGIASDKPEILKQIVER